MKSFKSRLKTLANKVLEPLAHRIDHTSIIPSFDRFAATLDRNGLTPRTIFDIGIAEGTPWLYEKWPRAKYHLFDPAPESLEHMEKWAGNLDAEVHHVALGAKEGTITINVRPNDLGGSTIFESGMPPSEVRAQEVPLKRFDGLIGASIARPALVKIDVQGAELMVLQGMTGRLPDMDALIIEVSVFQLLPGAPDFADVVAFMKRNGFVLFDIVGVLRRPLDDALCTIDAAFVPIQSVLRKDSRWSA